MHVYGRRRLCGLQRWWAWCEPGAAVSNCVLTGNAAARYGGGSYGGILYNCVLTRNSATWGGGTAAALLHNCTLTDNIGTYGGGAYEGYLYNSIVYYNSASNGPNWHSDALYETNFVSDVNQQTNGWVYLGTYSFRVSGSDCVQVTADGESPRPLWPTR